MRETDSPTAAFVPLQERAQHVIGRWQPESVSPVWESVHEKTTEGASHPRGSPKNFLRLRKVWQDLQMSDLNQTAHAEGSHEGRPEEAVPHLRGVVQRSRDFGHAHEETHREAIQWKHFWPEVRLEKLI